jgi:hypothetical protein
MAIAVGAALRSGAEGGDDVLGAQANVETVNAEAAAGDADEERLAGRAGYECAVLDQPAQIASTSSPRSRHLIEPTKSICSLVA